jgi:hypothetical protein
MLYFTKLTIFLAKLEAIVVSLSWVPLVAACKSLLDKFVVSVVV